MGGANTGPVCNAISEIIDEGNVIPPYSPAKFGSRPGHYQGGGNLGECRAFGLPAPARPPTSNAGPAVDCACGHPHRAIPSPADLPGGAAYGDGLRKAGESMSRPCSQPYAAYPQEGKRKSSRVKFWAKTASRGWG